jgi:hypothetical protein
MRLPDRPGARMSIALPVVMLLSAIVLSGCAPNRAGLSVGDVAPAFSLPSVSSGEVELSDYQGQPVLLFFHMAVG